LKIYRKEGDVIQLVAFPEEEVEKGDYLLIEDQKRGRGLLVQIIDIQFANIPGILEDILRDVITEENIAGEDLDPLNISSQIAILKDARLLVCKIRGALESGISTRNVTWLPSRINSKIEPFPIEKLAGEEASRRPVIIGKTKSGAYLTADARRLDGRLNIVTGKKGTGKSHLSKLLVLSLLENKAPCVILDVNGEYVNLGRKKDAPGQPADPRIHVLTPRKNLKFTLSEIGLGPFLSLMLYALDLPGISARVLSRIWRDLQSTGNLTLKGLAEAVSRSSSNESIKDALQSRLNTIHDSGLIVDSPQEGISVKTIISVLRAGEALVIDMKNQSSITRRMIVEILISKLADSLSAAHLKAIFLFAEEAHLYLRETYWDDIVTRMRHLGLFTTFITNQPNTIQENIYRQADNIFIFNFSNEHDLEVVSRASKADSESVRLLVKDLPPHHCLVLGDVVNDFPVVVDVRPLDVETMGETRYYFDD
jgi:hypothetical protein